jgi:hypothetical protein
MNSWMSMITVSILQNRWDTSHNFAALNFLTVFSCPFSLFHVETVLNVNSKKFKTDDGKKGIETSKTPLKPEASSEDDEHWNENKPIPEDYVPWLEHDHDKCIAEQLGLDLDAPIPAYCKPT